MTSDIDGLSQTAYDYGKDPLDWAITLVKTEIDVLTTITAARETIPESYPIYVWELSPEASARRIVGHLLGAGWSPPRTDLAGGVS